MQSPDEPIPEVRAEAPLVARLLGGILVLLVLFVCATAATLVVPMLIALLVSLMLAPAVRLLCSIRLPRFVAVLVVVVCLISTLGALAANLAAPAHQWLTEAPRSLQRLEHSLRSLQQPLRAATEASERLAELTDDDDDTAERVVAAKPSALSELLKATPAVLAGMLMTLILIFIFLLHGDSLLRKLVELAPVLSVKKEIVLATRSAQHDLSIYMLSITLINIMVGVLTALIVWWLGVPNPLLWGGVAALFNYAPYIGPLVALIALTVVGFGHFDNPVDALSLPGLFLLLNIIEGQLFTPLTVGRRMALDPVVVFVGLAVLGWLWGVAGVLLALPLLTCVRIVAEHVSGGETLAKILRRNEPVVVRPTG